LAQITKSPRFGFRHLDPIPTNTELSSFYESRYYDLIRKGGRAPDLRKLSEGGAVAERELLWLRNGMYRDLVETLRAYFPESKKVLDIGAGVGVFVSYVRDAGYEAEGIEPALEPSAAARTRGLNVHTANLSEWASSTSRHSTYDVVVMLNVLEHVPDPAAFVDDCVRLLVPGGALVVRVPNDFSEFQAAAHEKVGGDPWWICAPDHVNYFDVESLRNFLQMFGLATTYEMTDFPMEIFLLMGDNYLASGGEGVRVHDKRVQLDLALPATLRRKFYSALAGAGIGRNIMNFSRKHASKG
jgi:SAM-dependent methyltransferase